MRRCDNRTFANCSPACAYLRSQGVDDPQRACKAKPSVRRSIRRSLRACATVAPAFAARVAAILRNPCADPGTPAARHASLNALPNASFAKGCPFLLAMRARSPQGPTASVSASTGKIGSVTSVPVFSVLMVPTPSRIAGDRIALHRLDASRCRSGHQARPFAVCRSAIASHRRRRAPRSRLGSLRSSAVADRRRR